MYSAFYRPVKGDKRTKSRDGSSSGRSVAKPRKADSTRFVYPDFIRDMGVLGVLPIWWDFVSLLVFSFNTCTFTTKLYLASVSN